MKANELKRKRKEDSKVEENLLNNNKFSPLADDNNDEDAGQAGVEGVPTVPAPGKSAGKQKQPPLVVTGLRLNRLMEVMAFYKVEPEFKITRSGIKLTCFGLEEYDKVQAILLKGQVQFYSHGRRCERSSRVVLRGLPEMDVKDLKDLLKENHDLDVLDSKAIKRNGKSSTDEIPYIVSFPKGHTNLKKLSAVKKMGPVIIRWEAYRNKQPYVTQCRNCLRLGHGANNCHLKARCNNTEECKPVEPQAKRCANCSGAHEAMDRCCPKRAEFILSRQQASKPRPPARKAEKQSPPVPAFTPVEFPPLPGAVPDEHNPGLAGGSKKGTCTSAGRRKEKAEVGGSHNSTGPRAGDTPKAGGDEVLYSSEELWRIFVEFSARLKSSKTRSRLLEVGGRDRGV